MKRLLKWLLPGRLVAPLLPAYHIVRSVAANVLNGFPARKLKVIGVTGTNGKTTTIHFIASVLQSAGYRVGYSTSLGLMVGDIVVEEKQSTAAGPGTTRDPFVLQKFMKRMRRADVDWVVLEVTSHALAQYRTWGIPIHTAVLTNISEDHLDYHKSLEKYLAAKAKLFKTARHSVVLNHDDAQYDYFAKQVRAKIISYGRGQNSDVRLAQAKFHPDGSHLKFNRDQEAFQADIHLPGEFNAYNALAAASVGIALGLDSKTIKNGLESLESLPGRMEQIETSRGFRVVIDYAHTPDAFEQVFESLRKVSKGRLIAVFGGHIQHDYKGLGREAGRHADVIVITDDEPENADPADIRLTILDAAKAAADGNKQIFEIADRREGIKKAFDLAKPGDVVMLLCLGHQNYRRIGNKKVPWNDREEAEKLLSDEAIPSK